MNFEEIIGNQIFSLLAYLNICEDIRTIDLFVAIQVVKYSIVLGVLALGFALVRKLKTPQKRALGFVIVGAVFCNIIVFVLTPKGTKIGPLEQFICFAIINLMFVGIAFLPKLFKKLNAEEQLEVRDLRQTEINAKKGAMPCPGCGKKTISKFGVLHVAQSCGECGRSYKLFIPTYVKILEPTIPLGAMVLAYYLVSRGIQKSGLAILLVIISLLIVPVIKTKFGRLTQV